MSHRKHFDAVAPRWESMVVGAPTIRLQEIVSTLAIGSGDVILDAGCGTGVLFPMLLAKAKDPTHILAMDVSGEMLLRAQAKAFHIPLIQADGECLPLKPGLFDWIVANSVFPHFSNKQRALLEFHRLLRPGGHVAIFHFDSRDTVNERHLRIGGAVGGDSLPPDEELCELLAEAGFVDVTTQDLADRYVLTAVRDDR